MSRLQLVTSYGLGMNIGSDVLCEKIDLGKTISDCDGAATVFAIAKVAYSLRKAFPDTPCRVVSVHVQKKYEEYLVSLKIASFDIM